MGILDLLLGTNTNAAENKQTGIADAYRQKVGDSNDAMLRALIGGGDQIRNQYGTAASDVLNSTTGQAQGTVADYAGRAQDTLRNGVNSAVGTVTGSNAMFQPYVANGTTANALYSDSLGLNGADGNARATGAFQTGPGYQWNVDQATDGAARKAASLGMAASGNTLDAITRLSSHLADQEYSGWQDRLSGLGGQGLTAASAISGNNSTAAGFQNTGGIYGATLGQQAGTTLGGLSTSLGTQQANLFNGLGSSIAGDQTVLGTLLANNGTNTADAVNRMNVTDAQNQDMATSKNNGIFGQILSGGLNALGQTATGKGIFGGLAKL